MRATESFVWMHNKHFHLFLTPEKECVMIKEKAYDSYVSHGRSYEKRSAEKT